MYFKTNNNQYFGKDFQRNSEFGISGLEISEKN